jgi:serine/threonine protein kinase
VRVVVGSDSIAVMTTTEAPRATYRELGILAEGGMALVMRAVRESDGADVVVKRVRPPLCFDAGFLRLFRDEGALHGALDHEHIVRLLDQGEDEQGPYLVFEHISGTDLGAVLERAHGASPLDVELVLAIAIPLSGALAFVHEASCDGCALNAVHRDVSPANVLLGDDGAVKLADFGVAASRLKTDVTVAGELKGKFAYMAPEQTRGAPVTPQADLFALGVVLWECLANRRLFEAPTDADVVQQVRHKEAPRLDDPAVVSRPVDADLADLVAALLQKDPAARPARASLVRDALLAMAAERGLDDGLRRMVAQAVRQLPRRELSPIAPDVPARRRTQRVLGLATADTVRRLPVRPSLPIVMAAASLALVAVVVVGWRGMGSSSSLSSLTSPVKPDDPPKTLAPAPPVAALPVPSPPSLPPPPPSLPTAPVLPIRPPVAGISATPTLPKKPRPPSTPPATAPAVVEGFGRLSITSEPWARVRIDGVEVARETPLIAFPVRAGRHDVILENPVAGLSKRLVVDVGVDDHQRRFVDLQNP